jgi:hypothetical protein
VSNFVDSIEAFLKCIRPTAYADQHSLSWETHSCLAIKQFPFPMWSDDILPYFKKSHYFSLSFSADADNTVHIILYSVLLEWNAISHTTLSLCCNKLPFKTQLLLYSATTAKHQSSAFCTQFHFMSCKTHITYNCCFLSINRCVFVKETRVFTAR